MNNLPNILAKDEPIVTPMWLITGLRFKSVYFKGTVTVLGIAPHRNELLVEITYDGSEHGHEETWDLKVCIWAFESGEYYRNNS